MSTDRHMEMSKQIRAWADQLASLTNYSVHAPNPGLREIITEMWAFSDALKEKDFHPEVSLIEDWHAPLEERQRMVAKSLAEASARMLARGTFRNEELRQGIGDMQCAIEQLGLKSLDTRSSSLVVAREIINLTEDK